MTPHLVRFKTGDEFDALTKRGRRVHKFRPGTRAGIKRRFSPAGAAGLQGGRGLMDLASTAWLANTAGNTAENRDL
jgi:hypothetical protein